MAEENFVCCSRLVRTILIGARSMVHEMSKRVMFYSPLYSMARVAQTIESTVIYVVVTWLNDDDDESCSSI